MIRALLLAILALGALPAQAADPAPAEEEADPEYSSAAVAGVFDRLPPSSAGYPIDVLMEMRVRLGGAPPPKPEADEEEPADHGH